MENRYMTDSMTDDENVPFMVIFKNIPSKPTNL